ncbi:MAG: T9SS type A sorting domain-containing protein [Bacteroidia bacterium]
MRLSSFVILLLSFLQLSAQQTVGLLKNETGAYEGYTLFTPRHYHTSYLINNEGKMVNEWEQQDGLRVENCRLLDNGQLIRAVNLRLASFARHPGAHGKLELVNWDGTVSWSMVYGDQSYILHHEIIPIKQDDGSYHFLCSSWDKVSSTDAVENGRNPNAVGGNSQYLLLERLLEIKPIDTADYEIVWQWNMMDHLVQEDYPTKDNYIANGVSSNPQLMNFNHYKVGRNPDWMHVNGLDYNPELDQIIISNPGSDEFFIIDHGTTTAEAAGHSGGARGKGGDILYRWGNDNAYSVGTTKHFDALHGAYWITDGNKDAGKIMVLNNGKSSNASEIVIVDPDIDTLGNYNTPVAGKAFLPQNSAWKYSDGSNFHTGNMGNGQRLPNGNTLINEAVKGRFFEIDKNNTIVWEYICPVISTGPMNYDIKLSDIPTSNAGGDLENEVYKILRYATDYSGFKNKDLTPKGYIELNNPLTSINKKVFDSYVQAYPNPTLGVLTVSNLNENHQLEIITTSGKILNLMQSNGNSSVEFDLGQLPAGLYFLKLTNQANKSITVQKIIKE